MRISILCTKYLENHSLNFKKMILYFFPDKNITIENVYSVQNISEDCDFYMIICPQFFRNLIPKFKNKRFIIYQMEQLDKIKLDKKLIFLSQGIYDYTEINRKIYTNYKILHPPLSCYNFLDEKIKYKKEYDILFYGCMNKRRNNILSKIKHRFPNLKINIFTNKRGEELYEYIKKSKIVLNISYYSPAIFEISRINEIIPYGTFIISEINLIDDYTKRLYEKKIFFIENIELNLSKIYDCISEILQKTNFEQDYSDIINEINSHNKNIMYNILYKS